MKRIVRDLVILLAAPVIAMAATRNGPIGLDWHQGGYLYLLLKDSSVSILDVNTKRKVATVPPKFGLEPVEIFSARLKERESVFVSGFSGRAGVIDQYTTAGKPLAKFETPEQAASFDIDPARQLLYVASPVTNVVYAIRIDQPGSAAKRVAYIREADAVGPVIFDRGRNRVMLGDSARGVLYDVNVATGTYQPVAANLGRPISLGLDTAFKTLYVADELNGRIHVFRLENGAFQHSEFIPTGLQNLSAVTLGPNDTLFVVDGTHAYQLSLKTKKLTRFAH